MAFPPDLLTRLTRPLPWPYSAENELRSILNSWTASIESSTLGELNHELRVSTPSIKKLFVSPRPPETWKARSERPDWLVMVALRELYAGITPAEVDPSCMKLRPLRGSSVTRFSSMTCPREALSLSICQPRASTPISPATSRRVPSSVSLLERYMNR